MCTVSKKNVTVRQRRRVRVREGKWVREVRRGM
jgi:hypothetical protein